MHYKHKPPLKDLLQRRVYTFMEGNSDILGMSKGLGGRMNFAIKMFADGADISQIKQLSRNPLVSGFTTNPSLMRKAGVENYERFAKDALAIIDRKPISFEVLSDDLNEMVIQGKKISRWGKNIYVKIPITNSKGASTENVVQELGKEGISVNVTAVLTVGQVEKISKSLNKSTKNVVSFFAGRVADTGIDPIPMVHEIKKIQATTKNFELLWASPREILNLVQAEIAKCEVITMTSDLWKKVDSLGKNLETFSLETVQMFLNDALDSEFEI